MTQIKVATVDVRKLWMSQKEAMKYLGVSRDWLKDRRLEGKLHYSMVGTTAFYIKAELDDIIRRGAVTGTNVFKSQR